MVSFHCPLSSAKSSSVVSVQKLFVSALRDAAFAVPDTSGKAKEAMQSANVKVSTKISAFLFINIPPSI